MRPVADEVLQGLGDADLVCDPLFLLRGRDVIVQLALFNAVELERRVDDLLTKLVILGEEMFDL